MKTWDDYKNHVENVDSEAFNDIKEAETISSIITAIVNQRNAKGISQRELAALCDMPQSSVARIESYKTIPNLSTLLNILQHLGLQLSVTSAQ